jgi:dimethylargininase
MLLGLTRQPAPTLHRGELTFIERAPIDYERALVQHHDYCAALGASGVQVITLPALPDLPDSVFVEDTALVVDEMAVLCVPGAESRRPEVAHIRSELAKVRQVAAITPPATLEGGDILRIDKTLFVGRSSRTNAAGIAALAAILKPCGYRVVPVEVRGALHLKTACTALDEETLLVNPAWIDPSPLRASGRWRSHPRGRAANAALGAADHRPERVPARWR